MKNRLILLIWSLLAVFSVPAKTIRSNRAGSAAALRTGGFWQPGEYIENQAQWGAVRFGTKYDMAYGGCGILAVYNVLVSLGRPAAAEELEGLLEYFQKNGAAFGGKYGLSPMAIRHYLRQKGFRVSAAVIKRGTVIDSMEDRGETFLVTACNGAKLRDGLHTVCITKDGQGGFVVHNGYHLVELADGRKVYGAHGPFPGLGEAVRHISGEGAGAIVVMGIAI